MTVDQTVGKPFRVYLDAENLFYAFRDRGSVNPQVLACAQKLMPKHISPQDGTKLGPQYFDRLAAWLERKFDVVEALTYGKTEVLGGRLMARIKARKIWRHIAVEDGKNDVESGSLSRDRSAATMGP